MILILNVKPMHFDKFWIYNLGLYDKRDLKNPYYDVKN